MLEVATANMAFHQSTKQKGNNSFPESMGDYLVPSFITIVTRVFFFCIVTMQKKKITCKFLENGSYFSRSAFVREKRLIKNISLIIVIFLDNKYIKTLLNSNKILSEKFKPISAIKLEIIG